jgi:hypothetical protein
MPTANSPRGVTRQPRDIPVAARASVAWPASHVLGLGLLGRLYIGTGGVLRGSVNALLTATSVSPNWPARTSTFICSPRPERTSLAMNPDCELARLADELSDIAGSWRDQLGSARADVA